MPYVDCFVLPVPLDKLAAYRSLARKAGKIRREHGALDCVECVAGDVKPGEHTSFPQSVKLEEGGTVVFAWITYRWRKDRDRIDDKVMKDPRLATMMNPETLPFDARRMFRRGFKSLLRL